ncbi:MAG: hypothetical protein K9J21_07155 [Bacteroidales bacterium]|nr:hypothetical protein [Bacteroidales bacterium]
MKTSEFTEKQIKEIYVFLDEYVKKDKKVEAKQVIFSILRYDRTIMKHRLLSAWNNMLKQLDSI